MSTILKSVLAAAAFACLLALPARAADPTGVWLTEGGKSRIRIAECAGALCGTIVWLKEPNDAQGRPKMDRNNAEPALRNRPLVGVPILIDMKPNGPNKWSGQVYNAEDGKMYTANLTSQGPNAVRLEGCVLGGLICKGQTWSRVVEKNEKKK
jgi:uncharacterized protein (DUF2147 family)